MEDDKQTFNPDQGNVNAPIPNTPPSTPESSDPSPQPKTPDPASAFSNSSASWSPAPSSGGKTGIYGKLSLVLSSSAVGIFILLIFVSGLADSLTKAYMWFFVILALGAVGMVLGLLSEKNKENISLLGLIGIVVSIIVLINCLTIGSYYIKIQMEVNKFKSQLNSSSSTDFNFNSDNIYEGL